MPPPRHFPNQSLSSPFKLYLTSATSAGDSRLPAILYNEDEMSESELMYIVDAWQKGASESLAGFPREIDSLQEFRPLVEALRLQGSRDTVVRLYMRSGKNEVTQQTEWIP